MKFLHISDLHIGKRVNEFSMIEDQNYILRQILDIAAAERADAVLLAGDIYDKPMPSAEAVQMFDWFLTGLADLGKKVFAVSGNHDSPERIAFGARLMSGRGVYLSPVYDGKTDCHVMADAYGEIGIYLLPFVRPAVVRHALEGEAQSVPPESYQEAVKLAVDRMEIDRTRRNILVAHQFVTGAGRCDSEEVSVGGLDNVDGSVFDCFDYVALGHIHSPQSIGRESVRYCGTPLKYSFSEADQEKSVTVVELREKGQTDIYALPLHPLRDMRKIRGSYLELMSKSSYQDTNTEDYVQVTLTDEEDIPDGMQRLRTVYPNLMRLIYDNSRTRQDRSVDTAAQVEQKSELELFGEFFELQNNQPMCKEQADYVEKLIERLK
ncbi:MAG: exonuclease SbcCD subunit D [Lachnospiraceae bacterium]|nr:exonuclease SbcCD subunit D [Lachnospiraceae bacterium]